MDKYPGTPQHQTLLAQVVAHYQADPCIRAVCLFGSLARGNWDIHSDLDLDAVIADDAQIDVMAELQNLAAAFAPDTPLLIVPDGTDAGNIVLASLMELSIRYHPLAATSPNITDSLRVLTGPLDLDTIVAAGDANRKPPRVVDTHDVDRMLRWALEVNIAIRRGKFWQVVRLLQLMQTTLIEIFAFSRGHVRAYPAFDAHADVLLKAHLGKLLPGESLTSAQAALFAALDFLEIHLGALSAGKLSLTDNQRNMLAKIQLTLTTQDNEP